MAQARRRPNPTIAEAPALDEGMLPDFITGKPVKDAPKELVRQEAARALLQEYRISADDMEPDFAVKVDGKRRKIDIAVFGPGQPHTEEHLERAIVCRPQPKVGKRSVIKLRDHTQAAEDLDELKKIMNSLDACQWGLWTNGLERFFLKKDKRRSGTCFNPRGDWPMADGKMSTPDAGSETHLRRGTEETLRRAFQRCHNFIHGNEGMPKDAAFWQFLYLIFAKMYDERRNAGRRQFWADATEPFTKEGRMKVNRRIRTLFEAVKREYRTLFRPTDAITLSDRALSYMVSELSRYDFSRSDVDAKGAAYQEIVGANLRGDRGQYFTPRRVVECMVKILDPKPSERVLDPACGTGGFLVATISHQCERFKAEYKREPGDKTTGAIRDRLRNYAHEQVFGADFDPFLVRASTMNLMMAANTDGHIFHMDSLAFPKGQLPGNAPAKESIPLGSIDVLMTNPPFGSEIPITDPAILDEHALARAWRRDKDNGGRWYEAGTTHHAVAPEILFIERSVKWLRPGGRMGIVLPNGILGNPGDEPIRRWLLRNCWVLAGVEVPVEAFIVEANVGILASLLFLKKKTDDEMAAEAQGHVARYPIFMAVAEKAGVDRRGNPLYKRNPDGTERVVERIEQESYVLNGKTLTRPRKVRSRELDDDFPAISDAYREFRRKHREPGLA
jgi:type I restriction enzyme M protein